MWRWQVARWTWGKVRAREVHLGSSGNRACRKLWDRKGWATKENEQIGKKGRGRRFLEHLRLSLGEDPDRQLPEKT